MAINTKPDIHEQVVCANVFIRKGAEYLVLRRSALKRYAPNYVHPVGGKVDINENPHAAAIREVYEESGLRVKNMRLEAVLLEVLPEKDEPYNWLIFHFSADYDSGKLQQTEEGELIWLKADEIKKQKLFPSVALIIDHILSHDHGTVFGTIEYGENKTIVKHTVDVCVVH